MRRPTPFLRRALAAATFGTAAALTAILPPAAHAKISAADQRALAEMALRWAVDGGISDFKLLKDPSHLVVANSNLPKGVKLHVPGRTVTVLSGPRIQARANQQGDFLYFRFDRFSGDPQRASVALALVWAVSVNSKEHYLSGGGATLEFEKRDQKWQLLPVTERWMS